MEKIWLKHYTEEMAQEINPDSYASLVDFFEASFEKYKDRIAYSCMGADISYQELNDKSKRFAAWLQENFDKGDRIAVMMPNVLQYPVAIFGILWAGMTVVNVNPLYTTSELKHQLEDSGAVALIVMDTCAAIAEKVVGSTAIKEVITTRIGDYLGFPRSFIVNFIVKNIKKLVPAFSFNQALDFTKLVAGTNKDNYRKPEIKNTDIAFLQYTGGTTGVAKGAILTHRNIVANILQVYEFLKMTFKDKDGSQKIIITALPLYHIFSLLANCLTFAYVGAQNVLITNPRDIPGFIKELKKYRFNYFTGVNTLFNTLVNNSDFAKVDFSSCIYALGGGMTVQSTTAKKWHEVTGAVLTEAYGLTEASPAVTINPPGLKQYNGSIGVPIPSTDVSIMDDDGNELGVGESGELWIKGPQVMSGYWQSPDETALVLTDEGWLKTGDVVTVDDDGFFRIVDRKKDMILVSGFNVYPNEIEDVLTQHPQIVEVACIGVPDEKSGEAVKAFVVLAEGSDLTPDEIIDFSRESLTGYKTPHHVEMVAELPKNNVGKILRRELRE